MLLNGILLCGNTFLATILDTFACGINFLLNNKIKVDKEDFPPKTSMEEGLKFGIHFLGCL